MGWFKKSISRATGNFVKELGKGLGDSAGLIAEAIPGGHKFRREYKRAFDKAGKEIKSWDLPSLNSKTPEVTVETPEMPEMPDYSEYMNMMAEYMAKMNSALSATEPATEPLKAAQTAIGEAKDDTARKQLLRRGLMSTYTRYGSNGGTQKLGA